MAQWPNQISGGTVRTFHFVGRQPSWLARLAIIAAVLLLLALLALVVIPAIVIGVVALGVIAAAGRMRAWIAGAMAPNGALDGRRNVRVIGRE